MPDHAKPGVAIQAWPGAVSPAWLLGVRDLGWRWRRFLIAFLATGVVFALALLMTGIKAGLDDEPGHAVSFFHADAWVVPRGVSAPFGAPAPFRAAELDSIRAAPGVRRADPVVLLGGTVGTKDVNVVGVLSGGFTVTSAAVSRLLARGLVVADDSLGVSVGARLRLDGVSLRVGALTHGLTYFGGTPTLVVSLAKAQSLGLGGQDLATAIVTQGLPSRVPRGFVELTNAQVRNSLARPVEGADRVITLIRTLLWVVAGAIIAAILYLSALERTGDFAVLKAIGISTSTLVLALGLEAVVLSLASGLLAVGLTAALAPAAGLVVTLSWSSYVVLFAVAIAVGVLGSVLALRRAVTVDPASAFGV